MLKLPMNSGTHTHTYTHTRTLNINVLGIYLFFRWEDVTIEKEHMV